MTSTAAVEAAAKVLVEHPIALPQTGPPSPGQRMSESAWQSAKWLADVVEGSNDARGWLPSWRWDEWEERR